MNSLEEVLKLTLWSLPIRLGRERCYVLMSSTPPLLILVIVKRLKICCSEQVVFLFLNSHRSWNVTRAALVVFKEKIKGRKNILMSTLIQNLLKCCSQVWWVFWAYPWEMDILDLALAHTGNQSPGISSLQFLYKFPLREFQKYLTLW